VLLRSIGEYKANLNDLGNYPLTVGIQYPQVMRDGTFRFPQERDLSMRVPDAILACVGYVCEVTHSGESGVHGDPYATGFFVAIPCELPSLKGSLNIYFVTARHVADDLRDRQIYFSLNRKGGGILQDGVQIPDARWWVHPTDSNADVAVVQVAVSRDAAIFPIRTEFFALPQRMEALNIGVGDEIHAIGLFSKAPGVHSNMPIVRTGNIAMMPTEQIQTDLGYTDVYLVEARSIGGMSGSPVFVRPSFRQHQKNESGEIVPGFLHGPGDTLLGMVHGHWAIREEDINKPSFSHDRKRGVNYGIAVVVPAQKIYETLYSAPLVAARKEVEQQESRKHIPSPDRPEPKEETAFTKDDFESALKKASRKITPPNKK
jgi:hypothetical protein